MLEESGGGGTVVRIQIANSAHCLEFESDQLKADSALHPSDVNKMRAQIIGGNMLTL